MGESLSQPRLILDMINKLLHPLVPLKTEAEVEKFLNVTEPHIENTRFIADKETGLISEKNSLARDY